MWETYDGTGPEEQQRRNMLGPETDAWSSHRAHAPATSPLSPISYAMHSQCPCTGQQRHAPFHPTSKRVRTRHKSPRNWESQDHLRDLVPRISFHFLESSTLKRKAEVQATQTQPNVPVSQTHVRWLYHLHPWDPRGPLWTLEILRWETATVCAAACCAHPERRKTGRFKRSTPARA
ncbi:hypothetical protein BDN71DRAFT_1445239 [Pleurotus eryngii]|uniref:Uncharacterized protein n=1 Tax=Pleurotus eryngii TaxID=5323 RepID=A0A9P6DA83_PLEER|nr:hypothetical protein BDN71DRAFT_1445239 [Pleurotus eryngii]